VEGSWNTAMNFWVPNNDYFSSTLFSGPCNLLFPNETSQQEKFPICYPDSINLESDLDDNIFRTD
jgi:hypothetical protein